MRAFLFAAILFFPSFVFAGPPFIFTESAIPLEKGLYRVEGEGQFNKIPLGPRNSIFSLSFRYGLIHNLEIEAKLPYLFAQQGTKSRDKLGDLMLRTKVCFLKGREASPISVSGAMQVKVPTAPRNSLVNTTGESDVGFSLFTSKSIFPYTAHLNVGYTYIGNPPNGALSDRRDYSLGLEAVGPFPFLPYPNLTLMGELFGSDYISGGLSNDQWSSAIGASYPLQSEIILDGAVGFGLTTFAPDYTLHFRIRYLL